MSRRSSGEGTVYKASSGYWRGAIRLADGRRIWRTARTRLEVVRKLEEIKSHGSSSRERLGAFLVRWLAVKKPNVRGNTFVGYETAARIHITPSIGEVRLSHITALHGEKLLADVRAKGVSERTVQFVRTVAIMALDTAEDWGLLTKNWIRATATPRRRKKVNAAPFTPEEALAFITAAESHTDRALMLLSATTGARRGEIIGAKWSDFDGLYTDACTWHIQRTIQRVQGKLMEFPPKSESGDRRIGIPPRTVAALRDHRRSQLEARLRAGGDWRDNDFAFCGAQGQPLQPEYVHDSFKSLLAAAGLADRRFHDLRHTAASLLLAKHVPLKQVQEFMGHATATITLDIYAHLLDDSAQKITPIE